MATLTNSEVVTPKRALAVVTRHATLPPASGVMIKWFGRGDLSSLRHTGPHLMAFSASNLLMFGVIKADPECLGRFRCT
jgi:hypothetical protein